MSTSGIPSNLRQLLPQSNTPWHISPQVLQRMPPDNGQRFRKCELLSTDPETAFVTQYFLHSKPHNYAIAKIYCIHNPIQVQGFEAELFNIEDEAKNFFPRWQEESDKDRKIEVINRWKEQTNIFQPLIVQNTTLSNTKVLMLWHGSNQAKCE